jgi:hypothetical protein
MQAWQAHAVAAGTCPRAGEPRPARPRRHWQALRLGDCRLASGGQTSRGTCAARGSNTRRKGLGAKQVRPGTPLLHRCWQFSRHHSSLSPVTCGWSKAGSAWCAVTAVAPCYLSIKYHLSINLSIKYQAVSRVEQGRFGMVCGCARPGGKPVPGFRTAR